MTERKQIFFLAGFSIVFILIFMAIAFIIAPSNTYFGNKEDSESEKQGSLYVIIEKNHCGYVTYDENNKPEGYVVNLLTKIVDRAGMNIAFETLPSDQALLMVHEGYGDLLISDRLTTEYRNGDFLLTTPIINDSYVLLGKQKPKSLEDVANRRIALVENQSESLSYPIYSIFYDTMVYRNLDEALIDLQNNEFDYLFGRYSRLDAGLKNLGNSDIKVVFAIESCPWALGFCKNKPELKKEIESIMFQMMADRTVDKIESESIKYLFGSKVFLNKQPINHWIIAILLLFIFFAVLLFSVLYFDKTKSDYQKIFDILSEEYESVFLVDVKTDKIKNLRVNGSYNEHFARNEEDSNFYHRIQDVIIKNIYKDDKEYVGRAFNKNAILKELKKSNVYYISYRVVFENIILNYQAKIARTSRGPLKNFIVAIRSVTFDSNIDRLRDNQIPLVNVLLYDFEDVAYLDFDTGNISHYRFSDVLEKNIPSWRNMIDYRNRINMIVDNLVYEQDKVYFLEETKKENILMHLKDNPVYSIDFRIKTGEKILYYQLKFILISQNLNSVVLGFRNIDSEKRKELSQKRNLEMIEVLSSEYESVFYINLDTDSYIPYRVGENLLRRFTAIYKAIIPYSESWNYFINELVYEQDKTAMIELGDIKNLKENLQHVSSVSEIYRSMVNGKLEYFSAKFVKIDDENHTAVILGIKNCDEEIRYEREKQSQLEKAIIAAEVANKAKTTFLFNMSHDIRTPMNAILGFTAMARRNPDDKEKIMECLEKVEIAGNYLLELIDDILDMSRIENNKTTVELIPANIYNFSNDMIEIIRQRADEQNIIFTTEFSNITEPNIYADVLHTNQILLNILSNAVKYTKSGGKVHFKVEQIETTIINAAKFRFIIADTGIGMSEEFVKHIFESFSREKNTTLSGIKGTGLGMAITKKLIDLLGGTIAVESKVGRGTVVTFELTYQIVHDDIEVMQDASVEIENVTLEGKRVLLVEDNELNREIAQDVLESEGIAVDIAVDGIEAVEKMEKSADNPYNFVLMDIQMPRMDGYTAAKKIRELENKAVSKVPIIAMTANAFEEDKKKAFESGMDAHLAKPVDIQKLINTLKNFSNR
ncbi:MAG: response regulator [Treponema sp.]|nr:response regulator [Treponema sp.]